MNKAIEGANAPLFKYYSELDDIRLREQGRTLQKLVTHIKTVTDRDERTRLAHGLIAVMRTLNPQLKDNGDGGQQLWDQLFALANYELDIDSPFPQPERPRLAEKPGPLSYPKGTPKYRNLGRNIELLIDKVRKEENPEDKKMGELFMGRMMKSFYSGYAPEPYDNEYVMSKLSAMSDGEIQITAEDLVMDERFLQPRTNTDRRFYQNNKTKRFVGNNPKNKRPMGFTNTKRKK